MKTKINTLPGAAFSLLVTLGFTRYPAALARILIIGLAWLVAAPCEAAPPSGGGGGSTGGGTIYYVRETDTGTLVMTTMNSDGSGKTTLGGGMWGHPSRVLYNKHRWLIFTYVIPDQYYPDGITKRREVFALRDDFHSSLNNNASTVVQLTDDITLEPKVHSADWVPGGTQISFIGRRWSSAEPGATLAGGGIYTASLVFGADGNIIGLAAQPATPAIPFPLVETDYDGLWPALGTTFSWNPTGDVVVYVNLASTEMWLADRFNVHIRIFAGPGQAGSPEWSPDASTIVFRSGYGIATVKPDGASFTVIVPNTSTWVYSGPHFSPGSSHIVYTGCTRTNGNFDVFRATVKGDKRVNLTNTSTAGEFTNWLGAGWR